ncbi:pancreatic lipase-related protein 2 [Elysia marginata]|uniref:Pancreatic lipase-related protein 2 n=1 Tax=Elysia marginata TaxID=1093978 RepID=A0AAV4I448_9GAST|nr:pancreatic lipase-related protein 2 [Elysia marginata]
MTIIVLSVGEVAACNHLRSYKFFTESINSKCPFKAYPCASEEDFQANRCLSCQQEGCAYMGMHADKNRPPSLQYVKYYLSTDEHAPFCEYHLQITIKLGQAGTFGSETGDLSLVVKGSNTVTPRITLNSSPMKLSPGSVHTFYVGVPSDVGSVQSVDFSWHHVQSITDPLHWNILGTRHPKIAVDEVDVFTVENEAE